MKETRIFTKGLGAGAAVFLVMAAATCLWQGNRIAAWLSREGGAGRMRQQIERAERAAKLAPDHLDICRAAGI